MIRLLLAFALAVLVVAPALAGPTLRTAALVSGELVTAGDLIEGVGDRAGAPLFRAPDPGQTGAVSSIAVIDAAQRAGITNVESGGVAEVAVTRASRFVPLVEIEGAITARAATELNVDIEAIEVALDDAPSFHLDAAAKGPIEIVRFAVDPRTGRFEANLDVAGRPRGAAPLRVTGAAFETVEVATLARPLARGDVVAAADLKIVRRPKAQAADAAGPADVVGLAAKRPLREGQPLRASDLARPQHVERGAFVTLIYATEGVSLSLRAKALADGAAGDVVAVQNVQSKRVVNGVVSGPSEVTVTAPTTAVARR